MVLLRGLPDEVWGAPHDGRRSGDVARFDSWQRTILKFSSRRSISYAVRKSYRGLVGAEWLRKKIASKIDLRDRLPHRQPAAARHVQRPRKSARRREAAHPATHVWKVHVVFFALFLFATRGRVTCVQYGVQCSIQYHALFG